MYVRECLQFPVIDILPLCLITKKSPGTDKQWTKPSYDSFVAVTLLFDEVFLVVLNVNLCKSFQWVLDVYSWIPLLHL